MFLLNILLVIKSNAIENLLSVHVVCFYSDELIYYLNRRKWIDCILRSLIDRQKLQVIGYGRIVKLA